MEVRRARRVEVVDAVGGEQQRDIVKTYVTLTSIISEWPALEDNETAEMIAHMKQQIKQGLKENPCDFGEELKFDD